MKKFIGESRKSNYLNRPQTYQTNSLSDIITLYRKTSDIYRTRFGIYQHITSLVLENSQNKRKHQ
jgi:hypothetical protein